jgi:hypothetical protein
VTGRTRWIVVSLIGAAIIGGVLLFALPWLTHEKLNGASTIAVGPNKPSLTDLTSAVGPESSEMMKMARAAFLACGAPAAPTEVPDGKTATRDQMVSAHATVKAFDEATTIYTQCVDTTAYQASVRFKAVATSADTEALSALQTQLHNAAIDNDQTLANRFNVQLRRFKARGEK